MLKLKYLFENYDLAKTLLKNWAHDAHNLDAMLAQFRISSNAVYPFCTSGEVCFLRIAPVEEKLEKNLVGEMAFIEYLIAQGFPALAPLRTNSGELYVKATTEWGSYYATAFSKVKGIQLEDIEITNEIAVTYGKTLGQLHHLSAAYNPQVKKWTHEEVIAWIRTTLIAHGANDGALAELAAVEAALSALPTNQDNYGLAHYDFELDNVFYHADSNACSVIDFDDGIYHWYALDIEQVFDSLGDVLSGDALDSTKKAFMHGYTSACHRVDDTESMRPLMRRFINLFAYARLIRSVAETFADEPAWLLQLRTKLNEKISALENSFLQP